MANIALQLQRMADANSAKQMNWQEKMSNTSHQREVADLKKAGLNPVLSANSGAQSYSTSVDSAVNALGGIEQARLSSAATVKAAQLNYAATKYSVDHNIVINPLSYWLNGILPDENGGIISRAISAIKSWNKPKSSAKAVKDSFNSSFDPEDNPNWVSASGLNFGSLSSAFKSVNKFSKSSGSKSKFSFFSNLNHLSKDEYKKLAYATNYSGYLPTKQNMLNFLNYSITGDKKYLKHMMRK